MNNNIEELTMEKLKEFVRDNTTNQIIVKGGDYSNDLFLLTKIKYNKYITLLYKSERLSGDNDDNVSNMKLENMGFYNSKDDNLYDMSFIYFYFSINEEELSNTLSTRAIKESVIKEIEDKAYSMIDDSLLKDKKLSKENMERLEQYKKTSLKNNAKEKFLLGTQKVTIKEAIRDYGIRVSENFSIIDFITLETEEEKRKFIIAKAREHLQKYRDEVVLILKERDLLNVELKTICEDGNNILHARKAIIQAVKDKQTVNVTVLKNEQTFTFKTETRSLRSCGKYDEYLLFDIQAKDRQKYKELFGHEHYTADDILRITYGGKDIYTKNNFKSIHT